METAFSLTETLFGRRPEPEIWQDREVRFDLSQAELQCRKGEEVLDFLNDVEDTKGNNGEPGELTVTNLRVTWVCRRNRRTNISIGLDCIAQISVRPAASRLRGNVSALYILTRHQAQRFEFIFTALAPDSGGPELLAVVQGMSQAYEASRLYRELKLRGAIISEDDLRLLPSEQAYSKVNGVWNLSSDLGNQGVFFITNVRLVWYCSTTDAFNISLPYLQIKSVRVCDSKFGPCLVVETSLRAGGYVLGFRIEPKETLDYVQKEIGSLWQVYSQSPVFGVQYDAANVRGDAVAAQQQAAAAAARAEEDAPIVDDETVSRADAWAAACYAADGAGGGMPGSCAREACEPVFSKELGLAIEAPRDTATTVRQLWSVV